MMRAVILMACIAFVLSAQRRQVPARVPFVGCKGDGQAGPVDAAQGLPVRLPIPAEIAAQLAFYSSGQGLGVLAPRGWSCFWVYGSGGSAILVAPERIDGVRSFSGPAIELAFRFGDTSGRSDVAAVIARVFPKRMEFVRRVLEDFEFSASTFPTGPFPADRLVYKNANTVEFTTPARAEGLGTQSMLEKGDGPIEGVVILVGETPDLLQLSARLPAHFRGLMPMITGHVERNAVGKVEQ